MPLLRREVSQPAGTLSYRSEWGYRRLGQRTLPLPFVAIRKCPWPVDAGYWSERPPRYNGRAPVENDNRASAPRRIESIRISGAGESTVDKTDPFWRLKPWPEIAGERPQRFDGRRV